MSLRGGGYRRKLRTALGINSLEGISDGYNERKNVRCSHEQCSVRGNRRSDLSLEAFQEVVGASHRE